MQQQRLISTSKYVLIICRILFILLILMAIIPWLFPNSRVGGFLLTLTEFPRSVWSNHIPHMPSEYNETIVHDFMLHISLTSRILGFVGMLVSLLPLLIGTKIMIRLAKNYAIGDVFNRENAKSYSKLGFVYLLSALILQPLSQIFFSLSTSINNPVGQRVIAFSIDVSNLTAIFFAIMLVVIGQVMQFGHNINEERSLTI